VFNLYQNSFLDDITNKHIFRDVHVCVHCIEFQKRGLSHMHLLLSLFPHHRPSTLAQVDSIIHASWPNPKRKPRLFDVSKCCMVHGPCGQVFPHAPCMQDGKCSKGFPKPFQLVTLMTRDGYPMYACPPDGHMYNVGGFPADNHWIVPYNPYLLQQYALHIYFPSIPFLTV